MIEGVGLARYFESHLTVNISSSRKHTDKHPMVERTYYDRQLQQRHLLGSGVIEAPRSGDRHFTRVTDAPRQGDECVDVTVPLSVRHMPNKTNLICGENTLTYSAK